MIEKEREINSNAHMSLGDADMNAKALANVFRASLVQLWDGCSYSMIDWISWIRIH